MSQQNQNQGKPRKAAQQTNYNGENNTKPPEIKQNDVQHRGQPDQGGYTNSPQTEVKQHYNNYQNSNRRPRYNHQDRGNRRQRNTRRDNHKQRRYRNEGFSRNNRRNNEEEESKELKELRRVWFSLTNVLYKSEKSTITQCCREEQDFTIPNKLAHAMHIINLRIAIYTSMEAERLKERTRILTKAINNMGDTLVETKKLTVQHDATHRTKKNRAQQQGNQQLSVTKSDSNVGMEVETKENNDNSMTTPAANQLAGGQDVQIVQLPDETNDEEMSMQDEDYDVVVIQDEKQDEEQIPISAYQQQGYSRQATSEYRRAITSFKAVQNQLKTNYITGCKQQRKNEI